MSKTIAVHVRYKSLYITLPFSVKQQRAKCQVLLISEILWISLWNRPRSIYQYSNMAPRLSGQTSIFGVVFFVSNSPLGIERQKKREKFAILTRKPRSHARILIYRTWPIDSWHYIFNLRRFLERFAL